MEKAPRDALSRAPRPLLLLVAAAGVCDEAEPSMMIAPSPPLTLIELMMPARTTAAVPCSRARKKQAGTAQHSTASSIASASYHDYLRSRRARVAGLPAAWPGHQRQAAEDCSSARTLRDWQEMQGSRGLLVRVLLCA